MTNDNTITATMDSRLIRRQLTLPDGTVLLLQPDDVVKFERVTEEVTRSPIDGAWERTDTVEFSEGDANQWNGFRGGQWATFITDRKSLS